MRDDSIERRTTFRSKVTTDSISALAVHPSDDRLLELVMGRLPHRDGNPVADHLLACEQCAARIDQLDHQNDAFVSGLRRAAANGELQTACARFPDDVTPRMADLSGQTVGKYRIVSRLASGGMGVVYRAHDPVLDREIALKVLRLPGDIAYQRKRFITEARSAAKLIHPNVVSVFECGQEGENYFLAMEFVAGGSANDQLASSGPLPWKTATRIVAQAARGLHAAHQAGLIHRDVKPANLLLTNELDVKVADFGLVKTIDAESLTEIGEIVGSPNYMSPEQCRSESLDERSDVYSLGATFYALLTAKKPYDDCETVVELIYAHCNRPPPDPRKVDEQIPLAIAAVIRRAMAKAKSDRYASCSEMEAALQSVLGDRKKKIYPPFPSRARNSGRVEYQRGEDPVNSHLPLAVNGARTPSAEDDQPGSLPPVTRTSGKEESDRARIDPLTSVPSNWIHTHRGHWVTRNFIAMTVFAAFITAATVAFHQSTKNNSSNVETDQEIERQIATCVLQLGGSIETRWANADHVIRDVREFPDGEFSVVWIALEHNDQVTDELLEKCDALGRLGGIFSPRNRYH